VLREYTSLKAVLLNTACVGRGPFARTVNYSNVLEISFMPCLEDGVIYLKTNGNRTESAAGVGNSKGGKRETPNIELVSILERVRLSAF